MHAERSRPGEWDRRLCRQAEEEGWVGIVLVASPSNCEDNVFECRDCSPIVIGQWEGEVHDGLRLGMRVVRSTNVLLLMGDNYVRGRLTINTGPGSSTHLRAHET